MKASQSEDLSAHLVGDVTPRNLGMVGIQDLAADITPPTKPGTPTLVPGHCDPTCNVHDWYVGVRNGKVEKIWPVSARGLAY